ncbi:hypothetical protein C2869_10960 [Saccharobesus litoralis]|uniref:HTH lysR-type domain-containing protein n=1 Tax=Saccharobesus litoralis TaxID=2172099 RepID=A0A2S0VRV4_9ALTE|nr:LysR family transcriptional regulator [Saccharobesus litoralis]AWB66923.1 hypothetical protein C2869_10960 [Saccharobesus litoralis]
MTDWDDYQYFLALIRQGTVRKAAQILNVNHSTVSRRLEQFQRRLNVNLYERGPQGYILTEAGLKVKQTAEEIESLTLGCVKVVENKNQIIEGDVYLDLADIFIPIVSEALSNLCQQHPNLTLHLNADIHNANIDKREADIVIRFGQQPPEHLIGRPLGHLDFAVYCQKQKQPIYQDWQTAPWVRWPKHYRAHIIEQWIDQHIQQTTTAIRVNSYHALQQFVLSGAGVSLLVPWVEEGNPNLVRLSPVIEELNGQFWLLKHPDLRGVERVKCVFDCINHCFEQHIGKSNFFHRF